MCLRSTINNTNHLQIQQFAKWILDVGDGKLSEPNDDYALIEIPEQFLITNYDNPIHVIVKILRVSLERGILAWARKECVIDYTVSDAQHVIDYQQCVIDYTVSTAQNCHFSPRRESSSIVQDFTLPSDPFFAQARISRSSEASRTDNIILKIKIWGVTSLEREMLRLSESSLAWARGSDLSFF
ncbi:hypothetical protein Lal_00036757 [Lupinus albus]|nr:hypothetical protein Lal_00036757 [Lupinus albus]